MESAAGATYHPAEISASLLVQAVGLESSSVLVLLLQSLDLLLLCAHLSVDLNVEPEQVVDRVPGELLLTAIALESERKKTVLLSPVTEVYLPTCQQVPTVKCLTTWMR